MANDNHNSEGIKFDKLDFDALYVDAEKHERFGQCPHCPEGQHHMLCWCGVCFKYHHNDYFHEPMLEEGPLP